MPKNPIRRDEGPDPDSGGPRSLSDRFRVIKRNQPPSGSRGGSSSIRSGCSANKHSSSINFGLNFEIETSSLILSHQLNSKGIKHFATAEVIRKLGRGGFGSVYEVSISSGTGANSRRSFACKTIQIPRRGRCEVINRAKNEISVLRVLDNPNIIKLAGAFILDDRIFINTFPVADCNLKEFLNKQPSPLLNQVKKQIWQGAKGLASALTYLHGYGTGGGFHGDIKPENILVIQDIEGGPRMTFLLADFGSAKMPLSASIISTGRQAVTLKYCAPEWFKNEGKMGPPSDIWSFGCILMQIVTYLHDKTMTDFEAFRASRLEQRDDWTYHEALPAVNSWLQSLSLHFTHLARPILRKEHIDMIAEMLLHNPNERLSAADVVSQMGAESSETLLEGNATSHCGSTSMLRSQWVPQGGDRVFNSLFLLPESILREEFQRQPTSDTTVINVKPNQQGLRMPNRAAGTLEEAFMTRLALNDADETSREIPRDILSTKIHTQFAIRSERVDGLKKNDGKGTLAFDSGTQKSNRKKLGRCRPLSPEALERAKQMRRIGACWSCRFVKVSCSLSTPCERCSKISTRVCYRLSFQGYVGCFFPRFLTSHLRKSTVEDFIRRNSLFFTNNKIVVQMSSGPAFPRMALTVCEFRPSNPDILLLSYVENGPGNNCDKISLSYAPPVGILGDEVNHLKIKCLEYIKSITNQYQDLCDPPTISSNVLRAINTYQNSKLEGNITLLRKAVMFYSTLYSIRRPIIFTPESAKEVVRYLQSLRPLQVADRPIFTAKVLDLQIKGAMNILSAEMAKEVLGGLERHLLRSRARSSWAISFCVYLVLFICIEEVQIALDHAIIALLHKGSQIPLSRMDYCRQLDNESYKPLADIFHLAYKTQRANGKNGLGLNPIRNGFLIDKEEGIHQAEVDLVNEIKYLIAIHANEIMEAPADLVLDDGPDLLSQHMAFRKRNSGRLVSIFLRTFI